VKEKKGKKVRGMCEKVAARERKEGTEKRNTNRLYQLKER
jgi:hypothetical protein